MYARFNVSRETASDFMRLFANRSAYGVQAVRSLPNGSVPYYLARDRQTKEVKPLDADVARMHLNGDLTINLFAINPETHRSKWVAIDADFEGAIEALLQLQAELKRDGVEAALEQSRRGGHLWIFAAEPLLASECRIYVYSLALHLGVPVKGGPVKEGIEVFPRQDRIEVGEYGNAIRAPLGVHRKTNQRYWFYGAAFTPEAQLAYLNGLKKLTATELRALIQGLTLPTVYRPVVAPPYIPPVSSTLRAEFRILDYVRATRKDGRNWTARCPSCAQIGRDLPGDNLAIQMKNPRFYRCWAGCTKEEIRAALGQPIRSKVAA
ncbi:MAG: TOTE conflict system archaeo-eukaryotic primase domain-containing protein [Acidobacteriota bacterium]